MKMGLPPRLEDDDDGVMDDATGADLVLVAVSLLLQLLDDGADVVHAPLLLLLLPWAVMHVGGLSGSPSLLESELSRGVEASSTTMRGTPKPTMP